MISEPCAVFVFISSGVQEKLDYIQSVGYETLWIQAIHKSPMEDLSYDISDFKEIDPIFGTMEEFKNLLKAIHDRGMKVMLDFVPNHTSNQSEWFKKSVDKVEPYTNYYVWKDPKGYDPVTKLPIPPNNWLSVFGGSIWEWHEKRNQFYLHQFAKAQPDLDYRSPVVREAMKDVLRFWLDLGVDGFRVDAIMHLMEDELLRDNPWVSPEMEGSSQYHSQIHTYSQDRDDTYEVTHEWRLLLDEYKDSVRIMGVESYQRPPEMVRFFGNETYKNMHFPLNFFLPGFRLTTNATSLENTIRGWIDILPTTGVPSWMMGNHDLPRLTYMTFPEFSEAIFMIELLLPGLVNVYYGEEIGMKTSWIRPDQVVDSFHKRDWVRTPMQWDDSPNAGFTTKKKPWLPVNPDYYTNNVKKQLEAPKSRLQTFKRLMKLRKSAVIKDGHLETCVISPWLFMFRRSLDNQQPIAVIVNVGSETEPISISTQCSMTLPETMQVHTASVNSGYDIGDRFTISDKSGAQCSTLRPKASVVLTPMINPETNHATIPLMHPIFKSLLPLVLTTYFRYQS